MAVCSTTLWLGQLDKKTQRQDIMSLMEEFGQVESINVRMLLLLIDVNPSNLGYHLVVRVCF